MQRDLWQNGLLPQVPVLKIRQKPVRVRKGKTKHEIISEAEEISNMKIETVEDMKKAGKEILKLGPKYVLMKGGHLEGDAVDILIGEDTFEIYKSERIDRKNTHGTGCTISSAITSHLALGL